MPMMRQIIRHKQPVMSKVVPNQGNYQWIAKSRPGGGGPFPPATVLIQDTFTDANGVQLANHSPDIDAVGGGWITADATQITIDNNEAKSASGNRKPQIDSGQLDRIQSLLIIDNLSQAFTTGMLLRADGISLVANYYEARMEVAGNLLLLEDGTTTRASKAGVSVSLPQTIQGSTIGDDMTVSTNDGADEISYSTALYKDTFCGIRCQGLTGRCDDLLVTAP